MDHQQNQWSALLNADEQLVSYRKLVAHVQRLPTLPSLNDHETSSTSSLMKADKNNRNHDSSSSSFFSSFVTSSFECPQICDAPNTVKISSQPQNNSRLQQKKLQNQQPQTTLALYEADDDEEQIENNDESSYEEEDNRELSPFSTSAAEGRKSRSETEVPSEPPSFLSHDETTTTESSEGGLQQKAREKTKRMAEQPSQCDICGAQAEHFHYGVASCKRVLFCVLTIKILNVRSLYA
jgi:hypothetical protein